VLALSRHLSFHARGDAAFVWHGLTGDVAEMSRDVLALLLAFDPPCEEAEVAKAPPAGLTKEQIEDFVPILRSRRFLVGTGTAGKNVDELSPLLNGVPRIPRAAVYERALPKITLYGRDGKALELDEATAALFDRCDGERTLGQVLGDAGPQALPGLLRLARADVAALKILAKPASQGGVQLNPAAESTMPYPELPDARAYAAGGPAPSGAHEDDASFADLFRDPHPALHGKSFAGALAFALEQRGAFKEVRGRAPAAIDLEVSGRGFGEALRAALPKEVRFATLDPLAGRAGTVRADARLLPLQDESVDLIVASEIATLLGSLPEGDRVVNHGALALVREAARALAPGGILYLSDFGDPKNDPVPTASGFSIRFSDLQTEATRLGLGARVLPITEVVAIDTNVQALSTTRASWPALQALFAAHGLALPRRAWLRTEIEKLCEGKLDLAAVHGLQYAPLSERTMGLLTRQFWTLVATKPSRTLH
jgi:SAM-dependent methyltransferase